jgi:hypothetical protein
MFGYFTILAAVPGFFLSSFILNASVGCFCPGPGHRKNKLCHVYADNYHSLVGGGTSGGSGWSKTKLVTAILR